MSVIPDFSDRLRSVEENVGEIRTDVALITQSVKHITEKIDTGFKTVSIRLDEGHTRFNDNEKTMKGHTDFIDSLKKTEAKRVVARAKAKKAILPLLAAGAGVLGTKGAEMGWDWLVAFFK